MTAPFEPVRDAKAAEWLKGSLEAPWGRNTRANYVAAVAPKGFSAYARILHPAYDAQGVREVRWSEIADCFSRRAHAEMQWASITKGEGSDLTLSGIAAPHIGSLPQKQMRALVQVLRNHTRTPETCSYAIWNGWGAITRESPWVRTAQFELPDRCYYLVQGDLDSATTSVSPLSWQSVSIWWPKDRAWCVATEIDMMSTYVGGTASCIEEIIADEQFEAWQTDLDHRVDINGDYVNA